MIKIIMSDIKYYILFHIRIFHKIVEIMKIGESFSLILEATDLALSDILNARMESKPKICLFPRYINKQAKLVNSYRLFCLNLLSIFRGESPPSKTVLFLMKNCN